MYMISPIISTIVCVTIIATTTVWIESGKDKAKGRTTSELRVEPLKIKARPDARSSLNRLPMCFEINGMISIKAI